MFGMFSKEKKMQSMIEKLKIQMNKIDELKDDIVETNQGSFSAKKNVKILEEIKVPPLEILKDEPIKKKKN